MILFVGILKLVSQLWGSVCILESVHLTWELDLDVQSSSDRLKFTFYFSYYLDTHSVFLMCSLLY